MEGGDCLKRGLAQFVYLRGGLGKKERGRGVFEGGEVDTPNAHYEIYQYLIIYIILVFLFTSK